MRLDEAVEVDKAIRFWQDRALKYEQALREVSQSLREIDHFVGWWLNKEKPVDVVLSAIAIAARHGCNMADIAAALDKPGTEVENSANEVENQELKMPADEWVRLLKS